MRGEALTQPSLGDRRLTGVRKRAGVTADDYTGLPYHLLVVRDGEDKGKPWTASVEELPGCTSQGKTSEEALGGIQSAMAKWIAVALEEGREIPEPRSATSHSGRLLLRMPRTLHADLTRASEREGVSLNQFITDVLAAAVVWRAGPQASRPGTTTPINQAPGAEGLTAEPGARRRTKRSQTRVTTMALAANFVIVGVAGIVAIIVLIAAITR
jgi:antitoxin HicB